MRTRAELEMVRGRVDELLATLQARPGAVCAVRERIFSELYDELIREVNAGTWYLTLIMKQRDGVVHFYGVRHKPLRLGNYRE